MKLKRIISLRKATELNNSGFTLVELMVVVAVIGILVAIAVPVYNTQAEKTKETVDDANLRILNSATLIYRFSNQENDPFLDSSNTNEQLMALLVPAHLAERPIPQDAGKNYEWDFEEKKWVFNGNVSENAESIKIIKPHYLFIENNILKGFTDKYLVDHAGEEDLAIIITEDLNVTKVDLSAFEKYTINNITSLVLSDSVETIDHRAFQGIGLKELTLGKEIKIIKTHAFRDNKLSTLVLPEKVELIDHQAFRNNNITDLKIPSGVDVKDAYSAGIDHTFRQ
jgi:prepilin-type N-terminal cleavage/methylation domain-containing protein